MCECVLIYILSEKGELGDCVHMLTDHRTKHMGATTCKMVLARQSGVYIVHLSPALDFHRLSIGASVR